MQPVQTGTSEPLLSVVLPNYNHARYLARAIDAIARQSRPPDEIIVVDDGSTDGSRDLLAELQTLHSSLIVLSNEQNRGALFSLQRGLETAKGRYLYFAASDDQILPGFFSHAIAALEAAPVIGLFCAETILLDGATERKIGIRPAVRPLRSAGALSAPEIEDLLKRADNFIHTGSSIFRRRNILAKQGFMAEAGSFSDGLLARKIALTAGLWFMPSPVAMWHIHAEGLSRITALDRDKASHALIALPGLIKADPDFPAGMRTLFERRWRFGTARLALEQTPPDRDLLTAMAPNAHSDRVIVGALSPFLQFRIARLAILAWLTLRLRPFRLRDVVLTALDRRVETGIASGKAGLDRLRRRLGF